MHRRLPRRPNPARGSTGCTFLREPSHAATPPALFYPPQGWCFAVPAFFFRLPYALLDATLWSLIVYWAVGFDNSWRFLVFWLFMFLTCAWWVGGCRVGQAVGC